MAGLVLVCASTFGLPEYIPIQERAQGHALSGAVLFNDSVYSNPASFAFTQVYSVEGSMLMPGGFAASIVDTKTSVAGGALGYFRKPGAEPDLVVQGLRVGLAGRVSSTLAVGAIGKTIWRGGERFYDADSGVLANFSFLQVGAVARNVGGGNLALEHQEREFGVGARLNYKDSLYFSSSAQSRGQTMLSPYEYGFGAEFVSPYYFSIKGGYRFETELKQGHWSAGASFLSPRLLFHYAVEFASSVLDTNEHQIALSLLF
jgi:hypothetical protein